MAYQDPVTNKRRAPPNPHVSIRSTDTLKAQRDSMMDGTKPYTRKEFSDVDSEIVKRDVQADKNKATLDSLQAVNQKQDYKNMVRRRSTVFEP